MIQFLAPLLAPALGSAATAAGMGTVGSLLSSKILGPALLSGIGSLLTGEDIGDALKSAALGGVGGALGLGGAEAAGAEAAKAQTLSGVLSNLTGKEGLLSPGNLLLLSAFAPQSKAPERKPFIGGGYYGPGMTYVPASSVFGAAEGGRIEGPGTPTSDSIPAMIYQDGKPVQEAALSTQEVVLSHKDLAAMVPNGDYERASEIIGNAKNGDRAKAAAELYLKMQRT